MDSPTYTFQEFVEACGSGVNKVFIFKGAKETAKSDFNLSTESSVLNFIATGGVESPQFVNTKPWENNPNTKTNIMVDAYHFSSGLKYGYLAFMFQPATEKWSIKSFKKQDDPRNLPFADLLGNLTFKKEERS